jgi:hypothetical protein
VLRPWFNAPGQAVLGVGAVLSAAGALSFVVNIWSSLNAGEVRLANMQRAKPLPVKEHAA